MSLRESLAACLDHCVETRLGMPRVDWERLFSMLAPEQQGPAVLPVLAEVWLERLRDGGPPGGAIRGSRHFVALSWRPAKDSDRALQVAEELRTGILRLLRGVARDLQPLRLPLLLFADEAGYLDYTADHDPDDGGERATSGGMFVASGFPHLVLPHHRAAAEDEVLGHELTHAHLAHLDLPMWLNEGFATVLEKSLFGRGFVLPMDDGKAHRRYWDETTIQGFWSGAAFRDPQGQRLAYQLAEVLLRALAKDYPPLARFAAAAGPADAGAEAFRSVYRRELGTLLEGLLGPGPWQPVPYRW